MSNVTRWDPFSQLNAIQRQIFGDDWVLPTAGSNLATTDVYTQNDKSLIIEAHLPNFDQKDVNINVDNGMLVIQAENHQTTKDKSKKYVLRESSNSFYRTIQLPERAQESKIDANMKNGVLKITIPLKELPAPRKIQIKDKQ